MVFFDLAVSLYLLSVLNIPVLACDFLVSEGNDTLSILTLIILLLYDDGVIMFMP